ncbi:MAG: cell envelope integrity EipB family protein [Hyphomicrobiales bacterium]
MVLKFAVPALRSLPLMLALLAAPVTALAQGAGMPAGEGNSAGAEKPLEAPIVLVPHRAVYDLKLGSEAGEGGVAGLRGRMVFEFTGAACEGYSVNFRFVTDMTDNDGGRRISDLRSTSYESGDATSFRFISKDFLDNKLTDEVKGSAERGADGTITVKTLQPAKAEVKSDVRTLLPTEHLIETIAKARAGVAFFEAPIFDGSDDGTKFFATASVIGAPAVPAADDPETGAVPDVMKALPVWPVTLTYFDLEESAGELTPVYKLTFQLYDNGISRHVAMDYGEFGIDGTLVELTLLDPPACARAN